MWNLRKSLFNPQSEPQHKENQSIKATFGVRRLQAKVVASQKLCLWKYCAAVILTDWGRQSSVMCCYEHLSAQPLRLMSTRLVDFLWRQEMTCEEGLTDKKWEILMSFKTPPCMLVSKQPVWQFPLNQQTQIHFLHDGNQLMSTWLLLCVHLFVQPKYKPKVM